ncbi:uncharacterized protein BCR38DRAFT_413671 [Pseudomassariella vexata]|uniref:NAD(P)-binding domain-containing protein n=1 Tax=Pseudomassariella vexata TaxID=1141098 RepID=A0A1Y2DGE0_9PEZI|nr:uncharacterized protein BCR38DRAFT_413671 [Pseudomassariella vexata]ORY57755.1 hypothetical protein BCR38DRAFT_413671 [Pseudomassariella vexata]
MATPIILCGKFEQVGQVVKNTIQPEFEVVHFISSPESGQTTIPLLVKGEAPTNSSDNIGSRNYAVASKAVVVGAMYDDAWVENLAKEVDVPVLRPERLVGNPTGPPDAAAVQAVAKRVKEGLQKLVDEGKLGQAGVFWY